jgi:hypothetical protein
MNEPTERPEPAEPAPEQPAQERIALHGDDPKQRRRRTFSLLFVLVLISAAVGGIFGLFLGRTGGLIAAAIVALPLLFIVLYSTRRQVWLERGDLVVRTWGKRRIPVAEATRVDVVITQVRGNRTVGLLIGGGKGGAVKVDLAVYTSNGGRELGVLPLRRLANALMNNTEANGMIFAELLVAQLRSEAKGDPVDARPLHRLAFAAPGDKLAQRYTVQAISRFVASLD